MPEYNRAYYEWQQLGSLSSAREMIPLLLQFLRPNSVVDVGCGVGTWLSVFRQHGVEELLGIDEVAMERDLLQIPEEQFLPYDLRKPIDIGKRYDLAISLEVAEHLPIESAKIFVESLVKLSDVVMFSAAIPHQGGYRHLNEQWPDFWARYFLNYGYEPVDCLRSRVWTNDKVDWWYAQNTLIYIKKSSLSNYPLLIEAYKHTDPSQLSIVHPKQYLGLYQSLRAGG